MAASTASGYAAIARPESIRDELEDELERTLDRVLRISGGVVLLSAVAVPFTMSRVAPTLGLHVLFALVLCGSYLYLRAHRRRTAGALLAGGFWTVATFAVFAFGGVHSPGVFVYLPVVATAGLFWSRRAATVLAIASAGSVLVAAQLDALGALPAPLAPVPPQRLWTVFSGSLLMTVVLFLSALRRLSTLRRDLTESKTLLEDLALAQARAENERTELERRLSNVERLESVGRLAGGVAHDFNNLLSVILNSAAVLRREVPRDSFGADLLSEIDEATKRAIELVKKLLVNPGRTPSAAKPVDLNAVVVGLTGILKRITGPAIELVIHARAQNATVLADPGELEQVILNLALNARDAMPHGGRLHVETKNARSSAPATSVELVVSDEGVGMDAATAGRIFEPFFTTKGSAGGTGLGLASVKRIVDQASGSIRVATSPGQGARFEIVLPGALRSAGETPPA